MQSAQLACMALFRRCRMYLANVVIHIDQKVDPASLLKSNSTLHMLLWEKEGVASITYDTRLQTRMRLWRAANAPKIALDYQLLHVMQNCLYIFGINLEHQ